MAGRFASFRGTLREGIPPGTFEGLATRLGTLGMRVTVESTPPSYRESAAPRCSLRVEQAAGDTTAGMFDHLRVWQEDEATLRYEGTFTRWAKHFAAAWLGFVVSSAIVVSWCLGSPWFAAAAGVLLTLVPAVLLARHRRRACAWVERMAREEMRRVYVPRSSAVVAPVPVGAAMPASPSGPASSSSVDVVALRCEVHAADPALAAAARIARDAFAVATEPAPEEQDAPELQRDWRIPPRPRG